MDAVTPANRTAWEAASQENVREYGDLPAQGRRAPLSPERSESSCGRYWAARQRWCTCRAVTAWMMSPSSGEMRDA